MAKPRTPLESELLLIREYIGFNVETGKLFRLKHINSNSLKGDEYKPFDSYLYIKIGLNGKQYKGHRVAWFLYYNEWPSLHIDHINGIPSDNRISNLRLIYNSENIINRKANRNGHLVGVSWSKKLNKWRATSPKSYLNRINKPRKHLGYFINKEDAANAVIDFCTKGE